MGFIERRMEMKKFKDWFEENHEGFPEGNISGEWFVEHNLPMIVECRCCTTTMALPNAMIDEEGYLYCTSCVD
jgi:hypothetical protein